MENNKNSTTPLRLTLNANSVAVTPTPLNAFESSNGSSIFDSNSSNTPSRGIRILGSNNNSINNSKMPMSQSFNDTPLRYENVISDSCVEISNSRNSNAGFIQYNSDDDDELSEYEHLGISKHNVASYPRESPYCNVSLPRNTIIMPSSGKYQTPLSSSSSIRSRSRSNGTVMTTASKGNGALHTGVYSAQQMTLRDWFLVLDNKIKKDGRDVSLSELYLKRFEEEDITMHTLTLLTEADLVGIGVNKIGHRKLIMEAIAKIPRNGESVIVSTSLTQSTKPPNPLVFKMDSDAFPADKGTGSRESSRFNSSVSPPRSQQQQQQPQQQNYSPRAESPQLLPGVYDNQLPAQQSQSAAGSCNSNNSHHHHRHHHHHHHHSHNYDHNDSADIGSGGAPSAPKEVSLRMSGIGSSNVAGVPVAQYPVETNILLSDVDAVQKRGASPQQQNPGRSQALQSAGYGGRRGSVGSNEDAARRRKEAMEISMLISDVQLGEKIGEGSFGEVYVAMWHGNAVAAKKTKDLAFGSEIYSEYQMYVRIRHPNCVTFYGIYQEDFYLYLITEYMPDGSLRDFLQAHRNEIPIKVLLGFARDVAAGMKYLSSLGILHRDLASRNVLLKRSSSGAGLVAKVSDFGLSRMVTPQHNYYLSVSSLMPVQWSAPEALRDKRFSSKNDVWSYGVLLWEIFSGGAEPYAGIPNDKIRAYIEDGNRLQRPALCPEAMYSFMRRCWDYYETGRPDFNEVFTFVAAQHDSAPEPLQEDLVHLGLVPALKAQNGPAESVVGPGYAASTTTSEKAGSDGKSGLSPSVLAININAQWEDDDGWYKKQEAAAASGCRCCESHEPPQVKSPDPGDLGGMSILKLDVVRSYSLQQLYDESMGYSNPSASLSFAVALYQYGDLVAAYKELSRLISQRDRMPNTAEQVWAQAYLVRGTFNARFGDFLGASKDFSKAAEYMRSLNITKIPISTVKTEPESKNREFSKMFTLSDVLCAAGLSKFHYAMDICKEIGRSTESPRPQQEPRYTLKKALANLGESKKLFKAALGYVTSDRPARVRSVILFNIGQVYFSRAVYTQNLSRRKSLLEKAIKHYDYAQSFLMSSSSSPDIHFMKAKALALMGLFDEAHVEGEAAMEAAKEHGLPNPESYCIDFKSHSELLEPTNSSHNIVVATKVQHDFQQYKSFLSVSCSYCGAPFIDFKPVFCCTKCSYTVHEQCLSCTKDDMCFNPEYYKSSNKELLASTSPAASSGLSSSGGMFKLSLISSIYSFLSHSSSSSSAHTTPRKGADSNSNDGKPGNSKALSGSVTGLVFDEPKDISMKFSMYHVHKFRGPSSSYGKCAICSRTISLGSKVFCCVECKITAHEACLKDLKTYIILHPIEFPIAKTLPICGLNLFKK